MQSVSGESNADIFKTESIYSSMMLKLGIGQLYKVKGGQKLEEVASECATTVFAIVHRNGLKEELYDGQLIFLPEPANVYVVQAGDTKQLLCGGDAEFFQKNGTDVFYPGMRVRI